jgi:hypothetical protein
MSRSSRPLDEQDTAPVLVPAFWAEASKRVTTVVPPFSGSSHVLRKICVWP